MTDPDLIAAKERMLHRQLQGRGISCPRVLAAMGKVPRERFVPADQRAEAYADRAMAIDCQQTISQPYIVALMTQALEFTGPEKVLEVGTGSGYQTAILAELAAEVVSIERHPELSERAGAILAELGYQNVRLLVGDGTMGHAEGAPYDRITVTAAAEWCPPSLFEQLAEGGILVIPLGPEDHQILKAIRKVDGEPQTTTLTPCRFVPLIGEQGWRG